MLLEECELAAVKSDLTLSHAVELFTLVSHDSSSQRPTRIFSDPVASQVNEVEVKAFIEGDLKDYELLREMSFTFEEFAGALQRLFQAIPARGRTPAQRLEDTLNRLYKNAPEHLKLGLGKLKLQELAEERKHKEKVDRAAAASKEMDPEAEEEYQQITAAANQSGSSKGASRRSSLTTADCTLEKTIEAQLAAVQQGVLATVRAAGGEQ